MHSSSENNAETGRKDEEARQVKDYSLFVPCLSFVLHFAHNLEQRVGQHHSILMWFTLMDSA